MPRKYLKEKENDLLPRALEATALEEEAEAAAAQHGSESLVARRERRWDEQLRGDRERRERFQRGGGEVELTIGCVDSV